MNSLCQATCPRKKEGISGAPHMLMVMPLKWPFTTSVKPCLQYFSALTVQKNYLGKLVNSVDSWAPPTRILIHYSWGGSKNCLVKPVPWDWDTATWETLLDPKPPAGKNHTHCLEAALYRKMAPWRFWLWDSSFPWNVCLGINHGTSPKRRQVRRSRHPKILHSDRGLLGSTQHFINSPFSDDQLQKIIFLNLVKVSFRIADS